MHVNVSLQLLKRGASSGFDPLYASSFSYPSWDFPLISSSRESLFCAQFCTKVSKDFNTLKLETSQRKKIIYLLPPSLLVAGVSHLGAVITQSLHKVEYFFLKVTQPSLYTQSTCIFTHNYLKKILPSSLPASKNRNKKHLKITVNNKPRHAKHFKVEEQTSQEAWGTTCNYELALKNRYRWSVR